MRVTSFTDIGRVRSSNQDAVSSGRISDNFLWAVVCDGMGGANGGDIASKIAIDVISRNLKTMPRTLSANSIKNVLNTAIKNANTEVFYAAQADKALSGMGTTAVVCVAADKNLYINHVGDSRAYLWSGADKCLTQITKDHSIVQNMIELGELTREQARKHPQRNVITRVIGVSDSVEDDFNMLKVSKGDYIVICSDGLSDSLTDDEIAKAVCDYPFEVFTKKIVELANNNGGADNISVIIIEI